MNARPADRLAIALAQLNPTVGDIAGNAEKVRRARAAGRARRRRSRGVPRAVHLPAIRPRIWCSSRRSRRPAAPRSRSWRARPPTAGPAMLIGTPWVEDGKLYNASACSTAARSPRCASRSICRTTACSTRSACSRRVRCPGRSISAACASASRSARTSGMATETWSSAWPRPAARLLLVPNGSPYWRDKDDVRLNIAVARVTESGLPLVYVNRSAVRTSSCSTARRSGCTPTARSLSSFRRSVRSRHDACAGSGRQRLALHRRARSRRSRRGRQGGLRRLHAGAARLRRQERIQGRGARSLRRHRFRAGAPRWRSMRSGAERVRCVMLPYRFTSQESLDDAARGRQGARRAVRRGADRERGAGAGSGAGAGVRRHARAT